MLCCTIFRKIQRLWLSKIQNALIPGKVLVLYGPRQVGKTTLAKDLLSQVPLRSRFVNADELVYREALASQSRQKLAEVLGDADLLVIDEAQRVPEIGLNLKILVDSFNCSLCTNRHKSRCFHNSVIRFKRSRSRF